MAIVTLVAACNMRGVFSGRADAVMTGAAGPEHLRVIDACNRAECECAMAIFADIGGLYVNRCLADGRATVVAGHAIANYADMVEHRRLPGIDRMTIVALIV